MSLTLPPPAQRFDPITARWLTPGGWLPDPERDELDPDHGQPVELVGPLPRELAQLGTEPAARVAGRAGTAPRRRWLVLLALVLFVVAMLMGTLPLG